MKPTSWSATARVLALLAMLLPVAAAPALAQSGDSTARILVGFPPGGSADTIARVLADKLREELKRPVIVESRPGAGGRLLASLLKSQPNDGSVVMLAPDALLTTNPFVFRKLTYEPADLVPVSLVAEFPFAFATGAETGAKTFADYVKWARENRQAANFGSPAAGSPLHFVGLMVGKDIGVDLLHVPYQGGAPLVTALIGGQVSAGINTLTDMLEMHKSGRIRILAVPGAKRAAALPDVPTFAELGHRQVIARGFFGLYAPAGTPAEAVAAWNAALHRVLAQPAVRERLAALAFEARASTPAELDRMAREDAAIWGPVIKASGFAVD
ncbi:Bug family tripartite tricarboxylate transporter substrate binding protein [Piscinibacter sp.]|uniref:Bug family tripartite tricarboxylate transporter substrate binding protein n=1 Tax=Piscinibacter sp. TaxID=1903157 RepID=UPI002B6BEB52|nr:Bug family tripartite tricarboxylate transporter substrate binding protein [Albitalea sp.]HUG21066.1 Bug family tripartite tricarboxylate transporter substrate binding protein [Albitalea sp.]